MHEHGAARAEAEDAHAIPRVVDPLGHVESVGVAAPRVLGEAVLVEYAIVDELGLDLVVGRAVLAHFVVELFVAILDRHHQVDEARLLVYVRYATICQRVALRTHTHLLQLGRRRRRRQVFHVVHERLVHVLASLVVERNCECGAVIFVCFKNKSVIGFVRCDLKCAMHTRLHCTVLGVSLGRELFALEEGARLVRSALVVLNRIQLTQSDFDGLRFRSFVRSFVF